MTELDVVIIGAGLSGIAAGRYLRAEHPQRSFVIVEERPATGGTWDLFRYPGVRSDSDLHTYGYAFRPWTEPESIATGDRILAYLRATVADNGLTDHLRHGQRVTAARWSSARARWQLELTDTATGASTELSARWLFCATGYFRYDAGHVPAIPHRERFGGLVVHPQHWPADLDVTDRRVVIIGSGATAVTLAPALAGTAAAVTVVQRTPSYVLPVGRRDRTALRLRRWFGDRRGHRLTRAKNILVQQGIWRFCRTFPTTARRLIRRANADRLPAGYPVDVHFRPPYDPWDQRLCIVPGGDLFTAIRRGEVTMITDEVQAFTATGLRLASGAEVAADVVVTATGLELQLLGGISLSVDGREVAPADTVVHRGAMLSGVPNLIMAVGYTNASWTLKIDLLCRYFGRLLRSMDARGQDTACPVADPGMATRPLLDLDAGYVRRSEDRLPRQGRTGPWRTSTSYLTDLRRLRFGPLADRRLRRTGPADRVG